MLIIGEVVSFEYRFYLIPIFTVDSRGSVPFIKNGALISVKGYLTIGSRIKSKAAVDTVGSFDMNIVIACLEIIAYIINKVISILIVFFEIDFRIFCRKIFRYGVTEGYKSD